MRSPTVWLFGSGRQSDHPPLQGNATPAGRVHDQKASETWPDIGPPDLQQMVKHYTSTSDPSAPRPKIITLSIPTHLCGFQGVAKSIVNPQAFPNPRDRIHIGPPSTNLLSEEGRKMLAKGKTLLKVAIEEEA
ncbi:unnamed protein product [Taenia asiatica]|uniref:GMC_oxred_C domain-containing protein n=1 Tax=Taenia asiatica TaxID=60517 RepID=A0A0R3W7T3_TAEAS|nr:unnamed protein product [Taenia asiatica]